MLSLPNKGFVPVMIFFALWMAPILCGASPIGKIAWVNMSEDLKRLVVRGEGELPYPVISKMPRSSKVIMDFPQCSLGDFPRIIKPDKKLSREVRSEKTSSGARVTVDFGDGTIPEHRLRKIGDCIMVLFGEVPAEPAAAPARPPAPVVEQADRAARPQHAAPFSDERSTGTVLIKRARVVDSSIVLDVAPRNRATDVYRVILGLDFRQPGFTTAKIVRVSELVRNSSANGKIRSRSSETSSTGGPMKAPPSPPTESAPQTTRRGPTRVGAYRAADPNAEQSERPGVGLNPILGACSFLLGGAR
jgi:hypothetical protein